MLIIIDTILSQNWLLFAMPLSPYTLKWNLNFLNSSGQDWIQRAKDTTLAIWQEECKSSSRAASFLLPVIEEPIDILEPLCRQRKRVRLAAERHDAFEQFQELEEELHGSGPLEYWVDKRHSLDSRIRDLAAMAIDILSIPAMSSEPERVFSRLVLVSILYSLNILLIKYCVVQNCFSLIAGTA